MSKKEMQKRRKLADNLSEAMTAFLQHSVNLANDGDSRACKWMADAARAPMVELFRLAHKGNESAAEAVVDLVSGNVESLTYSPNKAVFSGVAKKRMYWPALMFAREKDGEAAVRAFAAQVHLGKDCGVKLRGKKADLSTPETRVAYSLWQQIDKERRSGASDLPPLSRDRETLKAWWQRAEVMFIEMFGEDFEDHEEFKHWHGKRISETIDKNTGKAVKVPLPRWQMRKEIKKNVLQSLKSLAE